ncbi:hypothetical protein DFA_12351 [Cavenderia fasciculata]|uniref:Uncharacterized protein n=1 Tax=Cavenderia fasciculata TaxID=261658 RepID=F4QDF6_CACFS|nr:uncharacterized protein DFA_12351 [Cavenderia fasciculata]EGG14574.1 hypothetical protein DFA_12351 [Cavenderia fasciculata]|eukprot:XP_004366094.1 hypothetical protein DFA_12351 [Cavenderia fasciculata]
MIRFEIVSNQIGGGGCSSRTTTTTINKSLILGSSSSSSSSSSSLHLTSFSYNDRLGYSSSTTYVNIQNNTSSANKTKQDLQKRLEQISRGTTNRLPQQPLLPNSSNLYLQYNPRTKERETITVEHFNTLSPKDKIFGLDKLDHVKDVGAVIQFYYDYKDDLEMRVNPKFYLKLMKALKNRQHKPEHLQLVETVYNSYERALGGKSEDAHSDMRRAILTTLISYYVVAGKLLDSLNKSTTVKMDQRLFTSITESLNQLDAPTCFKFYTSLKDDHAISSFISYWSFHHILNAAPTAHDAYQLWNRYAYISSVTKDPNTNTATTTKLANMKFVSRHSLETYARKLVYQTGYVYRRQVNIPAEVNIPHEMNQLFNMAKTSFVGLYDHTSFFYNLVLRSLLAEANLQDAWKLFLFLQKEAKESSPGVFDAETYRIMLEYLLAHCSQKLCSNLATQLITDQNYFSKQNSFIGQQDLRTLWENVAVSITQADNQSVIFPSIQLFKQMARTIPQHPYISRYQKMLEPYLLSKNISPSTIKSLFSH